MVAGTLTLGGFNVIRLCLFIGGDETPIIVSSIFKPILFNTILDFISLGVIFGAEDERC